MPGKRRSATQEEQAGPEDTHTGRQQRRSGRRDQRAGTAGERQQREGGEARGTRAEEDGQSAVHERMGSRAAEQELDTEDDRRSVRRRRRADGQESPAEDRQEMPEERDEDAEDDRRTTVRRRRRAGGPDDGQETSAEDDQEELAEYDDQEEPEEDDGQEASAEDDQSDTAGDEEGAAKRGPVHRHAHVSSDQRRRDDKPGGSGRRTTRVRRENVEGRVQQVRLSARDAAKAGMRGLAEVISNEPVGVTEVTPRHDGWLVAVEVIEVQRLPSSADLLALYEAELDWDGTLRSYRRVKRYSRGRGEDSR